MKKLISLVLVLMLLLTFAVGCQDDTTTTAAPGGDDTTTTTTKDDGGEDTTEPSEGGSDYAEPIQVSMNVMNAEKNGNHARNEYIKEKFNLTFEYVPVSWGDWNEKIRTWIATDDAPDLIWWDLKGATAYEYKSWARQGAFAGITEEKLGDRANLLEVYNNAASIDALSVDGTLYSWPSLRDNPPEAQNCYTSHWSYRRDWAKEVGLYKEGDIYTFEEWRELIRAVLEQDPGENGAANAGLVMPTWAFPHAPVLFISAPAAEGNETCSYIKDDSGQYIWPAATEDYKRGVELTHEMYTEGLIYQDNMVFSGTESEDMTKSGLAFATYNVTGALNDWTTQMITDGVIEQREDFGIAIVSGWDGTWYMTQTEDYWTVTALSHKISDEATQRVFDFWDYLKTDEGILLRSYGVPGIDYNKTGDGLTDIELLWEYNEETETYVNPYTNVHEFNEANGSENGRTVLGPGTIMYQYEERDRLWNTFASGDVKSAIKPFDFYVAFGSAPNKDQYGTFNIEAKEKMTQLIAMPADTDVGALWQEWVDSMMPTVQLVLDELNSGALE